MEKNIWKIYSKWDSENIEEVFKTCGVVFIGKTGNQDDAVTNFKDKVKKGDLFFIYDGICLKSIATAKSDPQSLQSLIQKKINHNLDKNNIGIIMSKLGNNPQGIGVEADVERCTNNYNKFGPMNKNIVKMLGDFYQVL